MLNGRDAAAAAAVPINCTSRHDTDTDTAGMYGPRPSLYTRTRLTALCPGLSG